MQASQNLRVALVHDWLLAYRGGERVLAELCRLFPQADLYTLFYRPGSTHPVIENRRIQVSWLGHLPAVHRYYRWLLPLYPLAARTLRLGSYDLVISSSHAAAKAVAIAPRTIHVCYCHTPMRYVWHMRREYFPAPRNWLARARDGLLDALQTWDRRTAGNVDYFIANSQTVQRRIRECYGRASTVIYPPVDTDFYRPAAVPRREYYLVVGALVPYKRIDLAVAACTRLGRDLLIIGTGSEAKRLRAIAGPTVRFAGWLPDELVREHLQRCRALIFPGEEDFGMVPVEAQACGTPVIALGRGGATETVIPPEHSDQPTGLWFGEPTVESLCEAILRFEAHGHLFRRETCRRNALRFSRTRFRVALCQFVAHLGTQESDARGQGFHQAA
ncbi:GDP-mannose-dependent monoacylated alpha-(1-6)-phosphatidylinositol monomannoside mannosyltransferase [bacterium HR36]|nr:GDP-mannose-dependent monoacylated alpha-(1-6)-phosphatidylinositol monomannoside mannosyltransferase [bacterium HR36]